MAEAEATEGGRPFDGGRDIRGNVDGAGDTRHPVREGQEALRKEQISSMRPTAYIETSVVSYLTARPSRDVVIAAYQEITREWWRAAPTRFALVSSALVVAEAGAGDPDAARIRLEALGAVALLDATPDAEGLTHALVDHGAVPRQAADDAAHIAIAVTNGVDFLVTWNFRHLANAALRVRIEQVCRRAGYEPPVICTPNELMEANNGKTTD